jgi:DNA-binding transcriptional regulator YiaG
MVSFREKLPQKVNSQRAENERFNSRAETSEIPDANRIERSRPNFVSQSNTGRGCHITNSRFSGEAIQEIRKNSQISPGRPSFANFMKFGTASLYINGSCLVMAH